MQTINLTITAERAEPVTSSHGATLYQTYVGVIKIGGLTWWVSDTRHVTQYEAEERARQRALGLLDDLRKT